MSTHPIDRRAFLKYVGYGAGAALLGPLARSATGEASSTAAGAARGALQPWVNVDGTPTWSPVPYPLPHPGDGGSAATDAQRFARYEVRDDIVLPEGFRYDVVATWGERFGPADRRSEQVSFGYNADYTALVPIAGSDEYWLVVNHEYISARPWLQGYAAAHGEALPSLRLLAGEDVLEIAGVKQRGTAVDLQDDAVRSMSQPGPQAAGVIGRAALDDLGVSVLRVRRLADGRFEVVRDAADHKRFSGIRQINAKGAATFSNCSGGTTPWGTVLTCEENFQDQTPESIDAKGEPIASRRKIFTAVGAHAATNLPFEFEGLGQAADPPLDGRDFGWVCSVNPQAGTLEKLHALGRFRHENVAVRAEAGKRLAAYMGDDRRGGHVWKFVSKDVVRDPKDPANESLLREGVLYAARLDEGFTGRWIPLMPETPLAMPEPEHLATRHLWLPDRQVGGHVAVGTTGAKHIELPLPAWLRTIERFTGKPYAEATLGDLVDPSVPDKLRVILLDAYVMANAAGATPCSRPEDVEVHPHDGSVYIAFTDSTGSGDGSPDIRIFPDSRGENSRQYGAIYRLQEAEDDPAAETFTWGKFVASGELAEEGTGFACADNLAFDADGNLWMVTDITTPRHNFAIDRSDAATSPGGGSFVGAFGNNALFMIPTKGPSAGVPHLFAIGPMECEMTGPTFTPDGRTLLLAIQHPGELHGTRYGRAAEERTLILATRDGRLFQQTRTVPLGSNFPGGRDGEAPKPCVVCITRSG